MTRATLAYLGTTVALLAVAALLILYLTRSNEPDQASSAVPVATSARGNPVNTTEGALNLARELFEASDPPLDLEGDLTSLQYVETTLGEARRLLASAQGSNFTWLSALPGDTSIWLFVGRGQFELSSRHATPVPYPAAIALIPRGAEGSASAPILEAPDLSQLGAVVDVPVPLPPFPTPIPLPDAD